MWEKIKHCCFHSLTVAWSYVLAIISLLLSFLDNIGDIIGDPSLKDQISGALDAKLASRILLAISILTLLARMRSIRGRQE